MSKVSFHLGMLGFHGFRFPIITMLEVHVQFSTYLLSPYPVPGIALHEH